MLNITKFTVNDWSENSYLVTSDNKDDKGFKRSFLVDAGFFYPEERQNLYNFLQENKIKLEAIFLTHTHLDHIFSHGIIKDKFQIPSYAHRLDEVVFNNFFTVTSNYSIPLADVGIESVGTIDSWVEETDSFNLLDHEFRIFHVPGHSPGSICLVSDEQEFIFAGDTLFKGNIGRTDLEFSNTQDLLTNLQTKVLKLPDTYKVYSGHGSDTTIGHERETNPALASIV